MASTRYLGKAFAGGVDLSIGQWQRLAIARALFRDAPVVVLDEPSASLDPRAESELFDLLHTLCRDRIVMFVSHRFATVRTADVVMVLDQGDVAEMGAHDELMAKGGLYHDLFELQAQRYGLGTFRSRQAQRPRRPECLRGRNDKSSAGFVSWLACRRRRLGRPWKSMPSKRKAQRSARVKSATEPRSVIVGVS